MYCLTCKCHEELCYCEDEQELVPETYCDNCGSICSEGDLDFGDNCTNLG